MPEDKENPRAELHQKVVDFLNELGADIVALPVFVPDQEGGSFRVSTQVYVVEKANEEPPRDDSRSDEDVEAPSADSKE